MLSEELWESLCNQCGKCCYLMLDNDTRSTTEACVLLDKSTNKCIEYENRFDKKLEKYGGGRRCVKLVEDMLEIYHDVNFLPKDCAYIKYWRRLNGLNESIQERI